MNKEPVTYVDEVIDFNNKDQIENVKQILQRKSRLVFDRKYFGGDVVVRQDWRTKLLIRCLDYILKDSEINDD